MQTHGSPARAGRHALGVTRREQPCHVMSRSMSCPEACHVRSHVMSAPQIGVEPAYRMSFGHDQQPVLPGRFRAAADRAMLDPDKDEIHSNDVCARCCAFSIRSSPGPAPALAGPLQGRAARRARDRPGLSDRAGDDGGLHRSVRAGAPRGARRASPTREPPPLLAPALPAALEGRYGGRLSVPGHGHRVLAGAGAAAGRRDPAAGLRGAATPLRRVRRLVRAQDPRHALGAPLTNRGAQPSRGRSRTRSCRASCTRRCWRRCSPRTPGASGRTPGR